MKYIFDENLSPGLARGLKEFGKDTEHITEHYPPGTPDEEVLKFLGENGCILITRDKRIHRRPNEILALKTHSVGAFFLQGSNMSSWDYVVQVVRIWTQIEEIVGKTRVPFAYTVNRHGTKLEKLSLN